MSKYDVQLQNRLAKVSEEFKKKLEADPDNGGPLVNVERYRELATNTESSEGVKSKSLLKTFLNFLLSN